MADAQSRAGGRYADPDISAYVDRIHAPHDTGLAAAFQSPEAHGMPSIQLAPSEGKLLELLVRLCGARKAVEVGTLAGYSAIRMARALPEGGMLWTVECDPDHARVASANIEAAGMAQRVQLLQGNGMSVLAGLTDQGPFDLVFVDADKGGYPGYGQWAAENLRPGGVLLGDNAYLFGQLMHDSDTARAMRRFHEETAQHFDSVCLPTPDGMLLGVRR